MWCITLSFIDTVKDAGIVGAGGAGFPTHVKLNAKAEYFIVNAAECEPLIETDKYLSVSISGSHSAAFTIKYSAFAFSFT